MITVKQFRKGECLWCGKQDEGVEIESRRFQLSGFLCKKDFWSWIKARSASVETEQPTGSATKAASAS